MHVLSLSDFPQRNMALFALGIETGFRISELLSIRIGGTYGVMTASGEVVRTIHVQRKYMKRKREGRGILLTHRAKSMIPPLVRVLAGQGYCQPDDYLFQSRRAGNCPICARTAERIICTAAASVNISENIGTHSMRKTFAVRYHAYLIKRQQQRETDIWNELRLALGHKDVATTQSYIPTSGAVLTEYLSRAEEKHDQPKLFPDM
jgi:integrase